MGCKAHTPEGRIHHVMEILLTTIAIHPFWLICIKKINTHAHFIQLTTGEDVQLSALETKLQFAANISRLQSDSAYTLTVLSEG